MHCNNYPCNLERRCDCKCEGCNLRNEFEALKKMVEDLKQNNAATNCPTCGKPYVEPYQQPIYPIIPWSPAPYIPGTPIGPYWTWPVTSGGTIENGLDKAVTINTSNWINGDGGSII